MNESAKTLHRCLARSAEAAVTTKATESAVKVDNALKEDTRAFGVSEETAEIPPSSSEKRKQAEAAPGQPGDVDQPGN